MSGLNKTLLLALAITVLGICVIAFGFFFALALMVVTVIGLQSAIWVQRSRGATELFGHPLPLFMLFLTEMWERFSYYGMRAIFMLYMTNYLLLESGYKAGIYGDYTGLVYITPLLGGFIADRYLGLQRTILFGGTLMALGQFLLAWHASGGPLNGPQAGQSLGMLFIGLFFLVFGNGLFKPNISTIIGQLYPVGDPRRDAGFTIFYMGINVGAFFSPLICGYLAQEIDWRWGFASAGAGMVFGTLTFWFGRRMLGEVGLHPAGAAHAVAKTDAPSTMRVLSAGERTLQVVLGIVAVAALGIGLYYGARAAGGNVLAMVDPVLWAVAVCVCLVVYVYLMPRCTKEEMAKVTAIYVLACFVMFFWAAFEQAGSSLTLFAYQLTRNSVMGKDFPSSWWQSANAIFIIALAPLFSMVWLLLANFKREPSTPLKMVIGIAFNAVSFAIMIPAAVATAEHRAAPIFLLTLYFLQTCGELCLSPVGLSMVTKLAPVRYAAMMMGVWFFVANAFGNKIAGSAAAFMESFGPGTLFMVVTGVLAGAAAVLLLFVPWLRKQMGGIH